MLVSAPPLSFRDGRSLAPNRKYGHAALRSLERRGENLTAGRGFLDPLSVVFFLHPSSFLRLGVGGRFPRDSTSARDRPCLLQGVRLLFSPFRLHALWPFMRTRSLWCSADFLYSCTQSFARVSNPSSCLRNCLISGGTGSGRCCNQSNVSSNH